VALDNVGEFVSRARDGDLASLEGLLAAVWDDAFRIARAIVLDDADAQDAAQDACAIVYATIPSLRSADAFPAWFYRIVVRCATQLAKRRARGSSIVDHVAAVHPASIDRIDLQNAIETLPLGLRVPLILHYYADLSTADIARAMRIPSGTVRFRIMLARRRLRPLLEIRPPHRNVEEVPTHAS
jgi:RNA polymerase sigma-70 factor (ECF subfamily)